VERRASADALHVAANSNLVAPSALERVLARDRWLIAAALTVLVVLAWGYLVLLSRQMGDAMPSMPAMPDMPNMPNMPGMAGMPGMGAPAPWAPGPLALTVLMWWAMMIGMMVPSAAPMILLFGNVQRRQLAAENPALRVALFAAGYLTIWGAFSVVAAATQAALTEAALLAPMDLTVTRWLGALIIALAGAYQLTPLKDVCLRRCRSPAEFLSSHWRRGHGGAFRMGIDHGLYCVGCCWLLMGLLFVVGVMSLLWVAAIAVFVLLEKLVPHGRTVGRIGGVAMLLFAAYLAFGA
jgi:predicted metal-binding membrane protein